MWFLPSGKWFDTKEGPGITQARRTPLTPPQPFPSAADSADSRVISPFCVQFIEAQIKPPNDGSKADYHVVIKTSSARNAGTDAQVWVNVVGKQGETGARSVS